jgi:hypothetical protein
MVGGGAKLPYDAEVEYLESTGTQWIDTGIYPDNNIGISTDVLFVGSYGNVFYCIFEARRAYHNADFGIINFVDTNSQLQFRYGSTDSYVGKLATDTVFTIETNGRVLSVGGVPKITCAESTFATPVTLKLFAADNNGQITPQASIRVYNFAIYKTNVLVRDFIPVRFTNEQGVSEGAMYDRANPNLGMNRDGTPRNDGLYLNRGTGSFVLPTTA